MRRRKRAPLLLIQLLPPIPRQPRILQPERQVMDQQPQVRVRITDLQQVVFPMALWPTVRMVLQQVALRTVPWQAALLTVPRQVVLLMARWQEAAHQQAAMRCTL
jgi:hypothetical protein